MIKKAKKSNSKNSQINTGVLVLENKRIFKGIGIGYQGEATGEVCFNTSLTGYQEIISDPSYAGQIINFTFPHIGNTGTNTEDNESNSAAALGMITRNIPTNASHWKADKNFENVKLYSHHGQSTRACWMIQDSNYLYYVSDRQDQINYFNKVEVFNETR